MALTNMLPVMVHSTVKLSVSLSDNPPSGILSLTPTWGHAEQLYGLDLWEPSLVPSNGKGGKLTFLIIN